MAHHIAFGILDISRPANACHEQFMNDAAPESHRPIHIKQQNNPAIWRVIENFVIIGVVKNQGLALFPMAVLRIYTDIAVALVLRHDECQMSAYHTLRDAPMMGDVISGREDRKECRAKFWDSL